MRPTDLEVFMKRTCGALGLALALLSGCSTNPVTDSAVHDPDVQASLEALCSTIYADCRRNQTVRLRTDDGSVKETHFEVSYPPVQNGELVTVFPGETIAIEGDWVEGRLTNLRSVPPPGDPERTIAFKFEQMEGKVDMMLTVSNPLETMIKYRLGLQTLDRDDVFKTSSCPVIAGGLAFELWPHPIFQLVVMDIEAIPDGGSMTCE
jgi:hypothetical protein